MKRPNKFVEKKLKNGKTRIQRYIFYKFWGLNPTECLFYYLRNILSFYLIRLCTLECIFYKERPNTKIRCYPQRRKKTNRGDLETKTFKVIT